MDGVVLRSLIKASPGSDVIQSMYACVGEGVGGGVGGGGGCVPVCVCVRASACVRARVHECVLPCARARDVCVCACVSARACMRAWACVCERGPFSLQNEQSLVWLDERLIDQLVD